MHSNAIEKYKLAIKLTRIQRDIVVGTILGDGHLETQDQGRTYRLKIEHSLAQKEYVDWLYGHLKTMVGTPPRKRVHPATFPNGSVMVGESYGFSTFSLGALRFYGQQFYRDGVKVIPRIIKNLISPVSLAIWFLDDGSFKSVKHRTYIIHAHGFVYEDLERLRSVLMRFGIDSALHRQVYPTKTYWRIYIRSNSAERFRNLIEPIVREIPSMIYKLGNTMPKG